MNDKILEKSLHIKDSLIAIDKLRHILCIPCPTMGNGQKDISFVNFDKETRESIKKAIRDTLDKREKELKEEFRKL